MGRPREYDEATADALLDAAERVADTEGIEAVSARRLAAEIGVTTRAVYSVFGSMDGLIVALGARAFAVLGAGVAGVRKTRDPVKDLVAAGLCFRSFAVTHPSRFRIGIQRTAIPGELAGMFRPAAQAAMGELEALVERVELGGRTVHVAASQFHALCEGLAALELRGVFVPADAEDFWRSALGALVSGFAMRPEPRRRLTSRA